MVSNHIKQYLKVKISKQVNMINFQGAITIQKDLNRETQSSYQITILASDNPRDTTKQLTGTAVITLTVLDVNDNSPVFLNTPYDTTVLENEPVGSKVADVKASDEDAGINGTSGISFYLSNSTNGSTYFAVDNRTGVLTIARSLINVLGNLEVEVVAEDGGGPPRKTVEAMMIIVQDTNNNAPKFVNEKPVYSLYEVRYVRIYVFNLIV